VDIIPALLLHYCIASAHPIGIVLQLKNSWQELPRDKGLVVFDSTGIHSTEAVRFLISVGMVNVANMAGGLVEWERDGMPLKVDSAERLSGSCMCQLRPRERK